MAVTPAQLKSPTGKIDGASMFPGEASATLDVRLQAYIDEGAARAGDADLVNPELDEATKLWAYHRAFEAVHIRLSATPASYDIAGEGSVAFTSAQISSFGTQASDYRTRFEALLNVEDLATPPIPSGGVATSVSF